MSGSAEAIVAAMIYVYISPYIYTPNITVKPTIHENCLTIYMYIYSALRSTIKI